MRKVLLLILTLCLVFPATTLGHVDYKNVDLAPTTYWSNNVQNITPPVTVLGCWEVAGIVPGETKYIKEGVGPNGTYGLAVFVDWVHWHGYLIDGDFVTGPDTRQFSDSTYGTTLGTRRMWVDIILNGQRYKTNVTKFVHQGGQKAYAIRNNC
jgi:hypothetical protein